MFSNNPVLGAIAAIVFLLIGYHEKDALRWLYGSLGVIILIELAIRIATK